tara:strand:+ start:524 stop:733 length:210 start_codon:yes stop_codon:yes gene_type:complete
MKVGDLVKFSEEFYPEYKGKVGMLVGQGYSTGSPVWKVMVDGRIHPFHVDTVDLEVIGYDDTKMIGGRL